VLLPPPAPACPSGRNGQVRDQGGGQGR